MMGSVGLKGTVGRVALQYLVGVGHVVGGTHMMNEFTFSLWFHIVFPFFF